MNNSLHSRMTQHKIAQTVDHYGEILPKSRDCTCQHGNSWHRNRTTHQPSRLLELWTIEYSHRMPTTWSQIPTSSPHQNPTLSLSAAAALVCVASNPEKIEDTTLECFESVVVAAVALLSSKPEVSQSKAALAGSVIVVVEILVVGLGVVGLVFMAEVTLLPPELVELVAEVSQSRAAWIGFEALVDEVMLVVVDAGEIFDGVFLFDGFWVVIKGGVNSDMESSSSRSSKNFKTIGREPAGVLVADPVDEFVVVEEGVADLGMNGVSCPKSSRISLESEIKMSWSGFCGPSHSTEETARKPMRTCR